MANKQDDENLIHCKTILVGNSGVGKTSIIARYNQKYDPYVKSTIGASFTNKLAIINDKQIIFEIWDTAGQERFRSINSIFYQDTYICLLVYDITDKKSFEDIKEYWHGSVVEQTSQDIIFHVVGNKIDLLDKEAVERDIVEEYCKEIGAEVSYISAREENNTSVDVLFTYLGEKFLKSDIYKNKETQLTMSKSIKLKNSGSGNKNHKIKNDPKKCC